MKLKYINKKKELNKLMNASETMTDNLAGAQSKLKTEIERVKGEIENANNKMEDQIGKGRRGAAQAEVYRKKIEELTKQLKLMEGEYNVVIKIQEIREKFGIDSANAAPRTRGRQAGINKRRAEKAAEAARKRHCGAQARLVVAVAAVAHLLTMLLNDSTFSAGAKFQRKPELPELLTRLKSLC